LSLILEDSPRPKYYLSKRACLGKPAGFGGIQPRRAEARGKELPTKLKEALEIQAGLTE
jgi:hypothetical protein